MRYLICIPCVNRLEKANVPNVIHMTFKCFEQGGIFQSKIPFDIYLFESGSTDISYLDFISQYQEKYPHIQIKIITHPSPLDGFTNTHRMFVHLQQEINQKEFHYDYVVWMDDDIVVCKRFMENLHGWMISYGKLSIFTSLYVCYPSFPTKLSHRVHYSYIHNYYGSCCTIMKPNLIQYAIPVFFQKVGKPDSKFRRSIEHFFPQNNTILVPSVSMVQHLNVGSVNHKDNKGYKGHRSHNFIGMMKDPKFYR